MLIFGLYKFYIVLNQWFANIVSFTLVVFLVLPIILTLVVYIPLTPGLNKIPAQYLKCIFLWFTIPYDGWKVIHKDKFDIDVVSEHWNKKVIYNWCYIDIILHNKDPSRIDRKSHLTILKFLYTHPIWIEQKGITIFALHSPLEKINQSRSFKSFLTARSPFCYR